MLDQEISALKSKIEIMDAALKLVSVRADITLNVLSALTAALGGTKTNAYREIAIKAVNDFSYKNTKLYECPIFEKTISDEKQHVIESLNSMLLPDLRQ